ncbi:membrane progestin receptor gamma-A-like [Acropora millepora]|uniref:membrane progestin receptor gamma-A-like n=1 Tax=Acropora millepora TaxID=45264 RepID=UPI001CF582F9|nr:membrane progestin receptor gamma-A-like [Acropora millepora]
MATDKDDNSKRLQEDCEIPKSFRYPFIKSGYRPVYSTPWQCFKSLFYINNETFNIWSHLLTASFFVVRYTMVVYHQAYSLSDPFIWPLLSSAIGTLTMYFTSSIAHLFCSMSEKGCKTCFFFDYAAISVYTFTSGQAMFFYIRPLNTNWMIFQSPLLYLSLAAIFSFLTTYGCCQTGALVNRFSAFLRVLPVLAAWINSNLPFIAGVTLCSCHASSTSCTSFSACHSVSLDYFIRHVICAVLAGFMYSTRLPERLLPGRFDLIGNSHHFLHIFAALGTEFAFKIIEFDTLNKNVWEKREDTLQGIITEISHFNTVGAAILVMIINAGMALWFSRALRDNNSQKRKLR